MRPEILVIGAMHLDVIVDAPHLPQPDETVIGRAVSYRAGGKGGNQAMAAARMGARTAMAGCIGSDQFGKRIRRSLRESGVNDRWVMEVDGPTGMSVAIVDPAGDYGAVIVSGVNSAIDAAAIDMPSSIKALLLQSEIPAAVNHAAIARAPDGCHVIFNAAPCRDRDLADREAMGRVDILVVNRIEAAMHAGLDEASLDVGLASGRLMDQGPAAVIITRGSEGLFVRTADGFLDLPGHAVDVVSSHGAGDAFVGALAAELAAGTGMRAAVDFAQAAAALTISTPPTRRPGLGRRQVLEFLERR